jgi:phosphoribosylglycinamide formyltransferase-1
LSGRGSNLRALLDAGDAGSLGGRVVVALSDVEDAPGLAIARARGVPAMYLAAGPGRARLGGSSAEAYRDTLKRFAVDVVVLAGFMRIVGCEILDAFPDRVVNIHPSLLPAFPGLHAQRQALEYGVKVAGCTAHLVDRSVDGGPILVQECVPVLAGDSEETLAERILLAEHRVLPRAVRLVAEGRVRREGRRILDAARGERSRPQETSP